MARFQTPYEQGEDGQVVARAANGRFVIVQWNNAHECWIRKNRREGSAYHRNLDIVVNDNLGGGPIYMTLAEARKEAGVKVS